MFNSWQQNIPACGLTEDSCDLTPIQCGDYTTPGTHIPTPGAWLIARSVSAIHAFWLNAYTSLDDAKGNIANTMGNFTNTFAPAAPEESLIDKIIDDFAEAVLNIVLGEILGPGLSKLSDTLGEAVFGPVEDQIKDSATDLVDNALSSGDIQVATQPDKADTLVETLQNIIGGQEKAMNDYLTLLFSGNAEYLPKLATQLSNGNWLLDQNQVQAPNLFDMTTAATVGFSALLLPTAWSLNNLQPMILVEQQNCDTGYPLKLMTSEATEQGRSCLYGDVTLHLVGFSNAQCTSSAGAPGGIPESQSAPCETNVFQLLPGFADLANIPINKDDIIRSVYNQWLLNGKQNGAQLNPNSSATDSATDGGGTTGPYPFSAGLATPGLFPGITVCDMNTASNTWLNSGPNEVQNATDLCP